MSCLTPVTILNPSKRFNARADKYAFEVPCGNCLSCKQSIQDEWFVRSYFQTQETDRLGGASYMFTLTYNDTSLPTFSQFVTIPELQSQSCFCKDDVITFLDTLRHSLRIKHSIHFKYFLCSEYGDNTRRPHYHLVLHLDKIIMPSVLRKHVQRSWSHGFIFMSKNRKSGSYVIDGHYASYYVSKYVTKDANFYDLHALKKYMDDKVIRKHIKPYCPFHLQSHGYGLSLLDIVKDNLIHYTQDGIRVGTREQLYNVPRYILNKLLYSYRTDGTRYLNDFGIRFKQQQVTYLIDTSLKSFHDDLLNLPYYLHYLPSDYSKVSLISVVDYNVALSKIQSLMEGRPYELLIIYRLFFRNRLSNNSTFSALKVWQQNTYYETVKDVLLQEVYTSIQSRHDSYNNFNPTMLNHCNKYNDNFLFRNFDQILIYLRDVKFHSQIYRAEAKHINYVNSHTLSQKLRETHTHYIS